MKPPDLSTLSHLWPTVGATSINRWRRVLSDITVRAPSGNHNNDDLLVWALHLLGGAERWVDVEELYLKAFELAPARLSWRTRPDLPDYKKCAKALQAVESPKGSNHHGLLAKNGSIRASAHDRWPALVRGTPGAALTPVSGRCRPKRRATRRCPAHPLPYELRCLQALDRYGRAHLPAG